MNRMEQNDKRSQRPMFVRFALYGLTRRASAWLSFWLSIAAAFACIALGFVNRYFFAGGALLIAALGYFWSIRWVDRHGHWD